MTSHVLVVDDEESILFALKDYLELRGCSVEYARTLEEAKSRVEAREFDAVIADLRLSPRNKRGGLELIELVRRRAPETRTLLLTAYGSPELEREAKEVGVDALLAKPIPLPEVARVLFELAGDPGAP